MAIRRRMNDLMQGFTQTRLAWDADMAALQQVTQEVSPARLVEYRQHIDWQRKIRRMYPEVHDRQLV